MQFMYINWNAQNNFFLKNIILREKKRKILSEIFTITPPTDIQKIDKLKGFLENLFFTWIKGNWITYIAYESISVGL